MAAYLDRIVAAHRAAATADERLVTPLLEAAAGAPAARPFAAALRGEEGVAVIAEIKRRSPSRGDLAPRLVAAEVARTYQAGGAAALSVLTDVEFFGGSPADLGQARAACRLPVLRKDFTVDRRDVLDARIMGADAVLLIVAALDDAELRALVALAAEVGLDALVEVHDEVEVDRALAAGATLVGVNQRDLLTFAVDPDRALRLAPLLPSETVRVAESGITGPDDVARLADAGYDAVLVGERLVTSSDPEGAVRSLRAAVLQP
ncbi:MAG: indole-3-glycerol phosphate synthase TrpC [Actinomycetota bacterium]|nr:indole-3-glycerol phosphate synthase TrpC [Actinomycetota bacterium]